MDFIIKMVHDARDFEGAWMAKEPEQIELSSQEVESLHERIKSFTVTKEDMVLFGKMLSFFVWVQLKLQRSQMTINKLKKIIFGKTEKSTNRSKKDSQKSDKNDKSSTSLSMENNSTSEDIISYSVEKATVNFSSDKPKKKGHGRISADEYIPDEIISVKHAILKAGDPCPEKCGGKLYQFQDNPGGVIRIKGQSCAHVVRYEFDKLRCALCGAVFTAEAPADFPKEKYDPYFKANLIIQKYFMASPFYRQEQFQKLLRFRLPDSTQWDLVESVANCVYPVVNVLEQMAANGTHVNHDDTKLKILEVMRANKLEPDKKRKGMFTTCIFAQSGIHKICLYYNGVNHGGENTSKILEKRDDSLPPIIRMCDALSANVPAALKTILCHCLTHGRRKFTDIETFFPDECGYVIEQLSFVYKYDAETKEKNMTADERLAHHQAHSAPVMEALKTWMQAQFDERKVEPNSALGGAIRYMQNHWKALTQFLSVSGAHLDNNLVERALKLAIRTRKNAMFYKTIHGAFVASLFLSLIATCELADKNPVHYLIALQENKSDVFKHPDLWLPWNYESTLLGLQKNAA
jgi:transposase